MIEIQKLRQRLSNAGSRALEFRMTMDEAKALLADIDSELIKSTKKVEIIKPNHAEDLVAVQHVVMDGGGLNYPAAPSPPEFKLPEGVLVNPRLAK